MSRLNVKVFPQRGEPPPDQPGYYRDPGNPYVFRLNWIPCQHRVIKKLPCGGCGTGHWCDLFDIKVNQHTCNPCEAVKFPLQMV
jgi:hypothetical protein